MFAQEAYLRLHRYISPILLLMLVIGISFNSDSYTVEASGGNYYVNSAVSSFENFEAEDTNTVEIDINANNYKIVKTAFKEIGNAGGEKYWSWAGFNRWAAWCCCFVSWCADQCGYIDSDVIPKFTSVSEGMMLFKKRNEWIPNTEIPEPGMIIFFDLIDSESNFVRDGYPDHVGIVAGVKDGYIYCIEGNYCNSCIETRYEIGCRNIYGYGAPNYR